MKTKLFLLSLIVASIFALLGAKDTFAASVYDANYRTTDVLQLTRTGFTTQDITESLFGIVDAGMGYRNSNGANANVNIPPYSTNFNLGSNADLCGNAGFITRYDNAIMNDRISVTNGLGYTNAGDGWGVKIEFADAGQTLTWSTNRVGFSATSNYGVIYLYFHSTGRYYLECSNTNSVYPVSTSPSFATPTMHAFNWFVGSNVNRNLPVGYEGEPIRDEPFVRPEVDYTPNWYISNIVDFKLTIHDSNFNTFDGNPFVCLSELSPVLNYEIWDRTDPEAEILLYTGLQSATLEINYQFPKVNADKDYRIVGWYYCGDDDFIFTDSSFYDFTITRAGINAIELLSVCMTEEYPFINFQGCVNNMNTAIQLLSFNVLNFNNSWSSTEACYELAVLGDWLNLEDHTICPQIPSYIRDVVTPFITFLFGILTITFISRNRGSEW